MVDRSVRMLRDCQAAVRVRTQAAETRHAGAVRDEADAADVARRADDALLQAAEDWRREMIGSFDPTLGGLFSHELLARERAREKAAAARSRATEARSGSADAWRREDARCRAVEDTAAQAVRRARRAADERLLAASADREAYRWRRR